jgi:hypothetical protein
LGKGILLNCVDDLLSVHFDDDVAKVSCFHIVKRFVETGCFRQIYVV